MNGDKNLEPLVYLNGQMVPASIAHLAIYDAGVVQGATVTELTRTFHQKPYKLDEHLDRLFRALRYTRMDIALSKEQLAAISLELVEQNARLLADGDELGLVQFVTAGEYPTYAGMAGRPVRTTPTICVHTFALPFELWARKMQAGLHLVTPSIRHVPPACYDPKMKYRSRMHFYLAEKEAQMVDPEASALLLDLDGNLTETNAANFLLVERGTIVSPTTINTLPGISRDTVIGLAGKLGIPFSERSLQVFNAINADEAFVSSTPYCLMPVTKINRLPIGDGKPGPVFRRLIQAWSLEVGLDIEKQIIAGGKRRHPAGISC
jgi:branched-subunit amino acid aminotransferase/4-amino-4-deoxychorismate lyase